VAHGLAGSDVAVDPTRLQHYPDPLAQRAIARARIVSEHRYLAVAALAVALEDLHRGGLARAVRSQQAEHLSPPDADVDAANRFECAVALDQIVHLDRRRHIAHGAITPRRPSRPTSARPWS